MKSARLMKAILFATLGLAALGLNIAEAVERPSVRRDTARAVVFTKLFRAADTNGDQILTFEEFSKSYGADARHVVTLFRYLNLSRGYYVVRGISVESGVRLEEFIRYKGGRVFNPTRTEMFYLADADEDGALDPSEFATTRPVKAVGATMKALKKLDKDSSGDLSPVEFGAEPRDIVLED